MVRVPQLRWVNDLNLHVISKPRLFMFGVTPTRFNNKGGQWL